MMKVDIDKEGETNTDQSDEVRQRRSERGDTVCEFLIIIIDFDLYIYLIPEL